MSLRCRLGKGEGREDRQSVRSPTVEGAKHGVCVVVVDSVGGICE